MKLPHHIFREYDIRGVAATDLTDAVATGVGRGFATMLGAQSRPLRIAVGRDCRLSSDRLFAALTAGLTTAGVHVLDIGVGPTPKLYASVYDLDADGGIMITGSHNAGPENGFKMMRGRASFFGKDIQELRAIIEQGSYAEVATRGDVAEVDFDARYVDMVTASIALQTTDIRFVVDAGNGAGGPLALRAMHKLGLKPDPLFCDMDGRFPNHHPDPTVPANLEALITRVRATGARVGLAFDGDADRLGVVDGDGTIVWGDRLMILFSRALLTKSPGAVVIGEVKCSQTLYDDIAKHGGKPLLWKTGHSLIKTKMKEEHALLAGEMSGHLFFADRYFGYDDGIYAALRLLEILSGDGRSLSEMLADVPRTFATAEIRVDCPDDLKSDVVAAVRAHYEAQGLPVVAIDGARISFGTESEPAWGLVRASNTGPILVMRFEATTPERRDAIHTEVGRIVSEARRRASETAAPDDKHHQQTGLDETIQCSSHGLP